MTTGHGKSSNHLSFDYYALSNVYTNRDELAQVYACSIFPLVYKTIHEKVESEGYSEEQISSYCKVTLEKEMGKVMQHEFLQILLDAEITMQLRNKLYLEDFIAITAKLERDISNNNYSNNVTQRLLNVNSYKLSLNNDDFSGEQPLDHGELKQHPNYLKTKEKLRNHRNGFYLRTLATNIGNIVIEMPRDRLGLFDSAIVPKRLRSITDTSALIFFFAVHDNPQELVSVLKTMSQYTLPERYYRAVVDNFCLKMRTFENSSLPSFIPYIFVSSLRINLTRNGQNDSYFMHFVYGIMPTGEYKLISLRALRDESSASWRETMLNLQERGLSNVSFFSISKNAVVGEIAKEIFPHSSIHNYFEQMVNPVINFDVNSMVAS